MILRKSFPLFVCFKSNQTTHDVSIAPSFPRPTSTLDIIRPDVEKETKKVKKENAALRNRNYLRQNKKGSKVEIETT